MLAARTRSDLQQDALASLCRTYWYPLFAFARRRGHSVTEAQDWTQGFFAALFENDFLQDVDREHGRFRSFLRATFKNHVANQQRAAKAQKRGGDHVILSLDLSDGENRYAREPYHDKRPNNSSITSGPARCSPM